MSHMFDPESLMFTAFQSPEWKAFEAYHDALPWFSSDPAVETQFTALDKLNARLRAYDASPEGQAEKRRGEAMLQMAGNVARAMTETIDREILAVLTKGEETE